MKEMSMYTHTQGVSSVLQLLFTTSAQSDFDEINCKSGIFDLLRAAEISDST
jgi:hypothetical protein